METGSPQNTEPDGPQGTIEALGNEPVWIALPPGLLKMRRLLLVVWLGLIALAAAGR